MADKICKHCGGDIGIRNPKGYCDHLYYPENCKVCQGIVKNKKQIVYTLIHEEISEYDNTLFSNLVGVFASKKLAEKAAQKSGLSKLSKIQKWEVKGDKNENLRTNHKWTQT